MESKKEIETLSKLLSEMDRNEGYTVPEGYFCQLSDSVNRRIEENQGHTVPQGYFNQLPEMVFDKIENSKINHKSTTIFQNMAIKWSAIAAIMVFGLAFLLLFRSTEDVTLVTPEQYVLLDDIDAENLMTYIDDIDIEDMIVVGIISGDIVDDMVLDIDIDTEAYLDIIIDDVELSSLQEFIF